mmetsp:Transcript_35399/g.114042  ORF Transcript_35399/g.114042 Transcript_35399/m.114042 type:complete len:417 (+) Transcript_35399:1-1251(+)|eukprot:scaffold912_cov108-Isochrysis_galbana.AAC.22
MATTSGSSSAMVTLWLMVLSLLTLAVPASSERRTLRSVVRRVRGGSDLDYPIPPNPFAPAHDKDGPKPPPPKLGYAASEMDGLTLPGGEGESRSAGPTGYHAAADAAETTPARPARHSKQSRWRPLLCLGLIAAGCALSRPADTGLLTALDAHHERYGALIPALLRDAEALVRESPLGSVALHSDLIWVGVLGAWLPVAPLSAAALRHWLPSLGAAQLLAYATLAGYLLRRTIPGSEAFLAASFRNSRRGRLWTLFTAAFSPAGLVHWLHAAALLLVVAPSLETQLGTWRTIAAFATAGASAALAASVAQAPFARSSSGRASTSGALMGLIALRASLLPTTPVRVGDYDVAIGRFLLLHLAMELLSNPSPRPRGAERFAGMLGGAAVVGMHNPQLWRELLTGAGWGRLADYMRGLV